MFEEIRQILHKEYGCDYEKISLSTTINKDLGVEGDDADEFFELLLKRTGKTIRLDMNEYFVEEGLFADRRKKKPMSIALLIQLFEEAAQEN